MTNASPISFRQLIDKESSTYTYILGCPETKKAVIIDPVLEQVERDLEISDQMGLDLELAINTHCHADHVSGTHKMKQLKPGVKSAISKASGAEADVLYEDGDVIKVGSCIELQVLSTPGHTDGCVSYLLTSSGVVFTGDALLIRGCGRTDFQGGSAEKLYESVTTKLFTLPDSTHVYPGHDYKGRTASTIGEEKVFNPRLTKDVAGFKDIMDNLGLAYPKQIDRAVPANLKDGKVQAAA